MSSQKDDSKLLGIKRKKKESNEKKVSLYKGYGKNEVLTEQKTFKKINEFNEYLSKLKNPFYISDDKIIDLNDYDNRVIFFYSNALSKIYQEENNTEIFNDYKLYLYNYITEKEEDPIKIDYPMTLDKLLVGHKFFFDLPNENCPKFYKGNDEHLPILISFFSSTNYNLFHLYMRKNSGTTLYLMKQMERKNEGFIYFDLRKLKEIIFNSKDINKFKNELKKFIFYSLFNVKSSYSDINIGFSQIEKYYYFIISKIELNQIKFNSNNFINNLFNVYITLFENEILEYLKLEEKNEYKNLTFIIDHYNYEISCDIFDKILNGKEKKIENLKFLITHSFNSRKEIDEFFAYLDDNKYIQNDRFTNLIKGIVVIRKSTIIGYYEEMYSFGKENFDDKNLEVLKMYKDELLDNFNLITPNYFYKFIDYMKDKEKNEKNEKTFASFLKNMSHEIELAIRNFYDDKLEDEYFFLSKYYNQYIKKNNKSTDIQQINLIKKNIPLNYFIIKFSKDKKDILDISPSCNLVKKIINKMSNNFSSILYQSEYFENLQNQGEKGNILQGAIEENLKKDPSILLNYNEKTLVFEIEHLIPSAKNINNEKKDPVEDYFKWISGKTNYTCESKELFFSKTEQNDMNNLYNIISKEKYENIILIQKDVYGKKYDFGIIKLIGENSFVIFAFQVTVSRDNKKFRSVNSNLEKDIRYLTDKISYYLKRDNSKGFYLFYVLDNQEKEETNLLNNSINIGKSKQVNYKNYLDNKLNNQVYLLYFSRKFLKFESEDGKIIRELTFEKESIKFNYLNINHYFFDDFTKKIFNKVIDIFLIKIGKFFIDLYDYNNIIGNYLIITKLDGSNATAIINNNCHKIHTIYIKQSTMKQISNDEVFEPKESYFFEIINPNDINNISLFSEINLN